MAVCIRHSFYKKSFSDQDVLGEKKGEKIAYSHQLHTGYKSGSKFFESLRYLLKYMSKKYSSDFFFEPWLRHACAGRVFIPLAWKWDPVFPSGIFPHSTNLGVSEIFRSPTFIG